MLRVQSAGPDTPDVMRRLLRQQGAILRRAQHPGVVELRSVADTAGEVSVATESPEGTLLTDATLSIGEVAGVCAVLATTVADLHDIGVAHGRLSAAAVVLDADGKPVLDEFSEAAWIPGPASRRTSHPLARADDRAVGDLMAGLLSRCGQPPVAVRRRARWRADDTDAGAILAELAAAAAGGRISTRALAEQIAHRVTSARLPSADRGSAGPAAEHAGAGDAPAHPAQAAAARRRVIATALVALGAALTSLALDRPRHTQAQPPWSFDDAVLTVAGTRYAVGRPGDVVTVGRWRCGSPSVALLRPSTAQVWVFDSWPRGAAAVQARPVAVVPGAVALATRRVGACDQLVVGRRDGRDEVIVR